MKSILIGILVMILLMGVVDLVMGNSMQSFLEEHSDRKSIVIGYGDSMWSIAREEYSTNDYDLNMVISALKQVNELDNANLAIGQELIIPIKEVK